MQLVNFAEDYTSDDPSLNPPINESQPNPMRRDTVLSPAGSAYTFRVVMDNPGAWFFHCKILPALLFSHSLTHSTDRPH